MGQITEQMIYEQNQTEIQTQNDKSRNVSKFHDSTNFFYFATLQNAKLAYIFIQSITLNDN